MKFARNQWQRGRSKQAKNRPATVNRFYMYFLPARANILRWNGNLSSLECEQGFGYHLPCPRDPGAVLPLRSSEFVESARAAGATGARIILRHLLPNILAPMLVFVLLNIGWMITETAGLSFLGLGTQPPTPDWGNMLSSGRNYLIDSPWIATFPGLAILTLVVALNVVGDSLRDTLDPRLRGE